MTTLAKVDFVKGHMGGNEIVLLEGSQIPKGMYVKTALSVLDAPSIRGDDAGILERPQRGGDIKVKIVNRSSRGFYTMCGGLTQVLWKATIETDLGKRYHVGRRRKQLIIETDLGSVRISVKSIGGKPSAFTDMTTFVEECYRLGISPIEVAGVKALKVGTFLVVDVCEIQKRSPEADFGKMDPKTREILMEIQADFDKQHFLNTPNTDFCLFDIYRDEPRHGRAVFPHNISGGHIEPSCGTGSVAIALALAETGRLGDGIVSLCLDSGGLPVLGGPETTQVNLIRHERKITAAEFSHSLVEIVATGKVWPPIH